MKKTVKSSNNNARKLIQSANEDELDETQDEVVDETEGADEFAPESDEGEGDTDGFDIDEGIVDEINENDDFGGEELAKEDIIDAIKVIDEIATAVTEKEGDEATMDADTVLNKVEEFTEDSVADEDMGDLDFGEEMPDELANSVVRVMVQDGTEDVAVETEPTVESIYTDTVEETPATVYNTDMDSSDFELDGEDDSEAEDDELLVVGNSRATSYKKGVIKLNSSLARKNPMNWKKAYKKVTSSLKNQKKILSASDWALIQCLAQKYNAELSEKMINVKRVVSAMKKSEKLKTMLQSQIDFENNTQASATQPFESNGAPKSELGLGEQVGSETGEVSENMGDGQSGEVESTFGDPSVSTTTEESKKGDFMSDPANTIETLTVPVSNSVSTTIVLKKVGSNTYVSCGYVPPKENKVRLVKANKEIVAQAKDNRVFNNALDGRTISFPDGTAMLLKSSNLYGLLACRAEFVRGIKGAKYEVFKKINSSFVSPNGIAISNNSESEYVIASSASNKSAKRVDCDYEGVFASLEKTLHQRELVINSIKAKQEARKQISSSRNPNDNARISQLSSMLRRRDAEIKRLTVLANGADAQVKSQIAERDREALFASSQKQMVEEKTAIKNSAQHNVDFMAKQMSRLF